MSTTTSIPVVVQPDAAARVTALGRQTELEQMIEHVRQMVLGIRYIEVQLRPSYDLGDDDRVVIEATIDKPHLDDDRTDRQLIRWQVDTFPPEVLEHFCILTTYGLDHEG